MFSSRIAAIGSRVSEIQARFAAEPPAGSVPRSSVGSASSRASFAGLLDSAQALAAPASVSGEQIVAEAQRYLGVPYVFGSSDPSVGLDCSGLVKKVFSSFGVDLPHLAQAQSKLGAPVASLDQARPGDLLAFDNTDDPSRPPVDHIGIYVGNGMMIHAPRTGGRVEYRSVPTGDDAPVAIRRLSGAAFAAPSVQAGAASAVSGYSPATGLASGALALPASAQLFGPSADMTPVPSDVPFAQLFDQVGRRTGVAPRLLAAVAYTESGFNPDAQSPAGAVGLMQFMPSTAASWGVNPRDPMSAVDGAGRLLSALYEQTGTVDLALAAYNAGLGAVRRYGGVPPFPETYAHGRRILDLLGRNQ